MSKKNKILLVHLVANGDCLMATTIARQIKKDYEGCHLTWAISFKSVPMLYLNPYVDEIMEINYGKDDSPFGNVWLNLKNQIKGMEFEHVFYTQIFPDNDWCYDGTTRSSTFRAYKHEINVPVTPVFRISPEEREKIAAFALKHKLGNYDHRILFECTPGSGQSSITLELAIAISEQLIRSNSSLIIIISTFKNFNSSSHRIINGAELTLRENAALSHHCNFLIGCSSGISWLLTSDDAKKLPSVQILNGNAYGFRFASMSYDFRYFGLNDSHIIETDCCTVNETSEIINHALENFQSARNKYHKIFVPGNDYCVFLAIEKIRKREWSKAITILMNFTKRNGFRLKLYVIFLKSILKLPFSKV